MSNTKDKKVRVRFAPSPTGALHIGGVRTALFNYLFAKKHCGDFLLRIEDTDQKRLVVDAEKYIIDSLAWLGIMPNEGINTDGTATYRQSEREYKSYVDTLLSTGHAYYAFDTEEEINKLRDLLKASGVKNLGYNNISRDRMKNSLTLSADEVKNLIDSGAPYVIRFNTPRNKEVKFLDAVKGNIVVNSNTLDDKVLFKSDGLPTYHMANVVDDHLMDITHVIRGDEWLPSAPLHILLYEAFGWDAPTFCHLPLILGKDGKKLSKRFVKPDTNDKDWFPVFPLTWDYTDDKGEKIHITGFKEEGYEPDALINFLALLGWNPGNNEEIMPEDKMVELFDLNRINNSGAMFDVEKLRNFNAHYVRSKDNMFLYDNYIKRDNVEFQNTAENINKVVEISKERAVFVKDLYKSVSYFFEPVIINYGVELKNPKEFTIAMNSLFGEDSFVFSAEEIKKRLDSICELNGFKIGKILPDLRTALTGGIPGPHLPETMEILGSVISYKRIEDLLNKTKINTKQVTN